MNMLTSPPHYLFIYPTNIYWAASIARISAKCWVSWHESALKVLAGQREHRPRNRFQSSMISTMVGKEDVQTYYSTAGTVITRSGMTSKRGLDRLTGFPRKTKDGGSRNGIETSQTVPVRRTVRWYQRSLKYRWVGGSTLDKWHASIYHVTYLMPFI